MQSRSSCYNNKIKKTVENTAWEEVGRRESRLGLLLERRYEDLWSRYECRTQRDAEGENQSSTCAAE